LVTPKILFAPLALNNNSGPETSKDKGTIIWYAGGAVDWETSVLPPGLDEVIPENTTSWKNWTLPTEHVFYSTRNHGIGEFLDEELLPILTTTIFNKS